MTKLCNCCKNLCQEFRDFFIRGNAFDLAVGIIIGSAITKVVQSLVDDILTPPFGLIFDGEDFANLTIKMRNYVRPTKPPVVIRYGKFVQIILQLLIVALGLFLVVKFLNKLHIIATRRAEAKIIEQKESNEEIKLLRDIRDLLGQNSIIQNER